jgi:predicted SAM-dependent methyltransferase
MKKDFLIFTHIPKTAGTSFRQILMNQAKRDHGFLCYPGLFENQTTKERILSLKERLIVEDREKGTKTQKIRAVAGHIGYGIHQMIPLRACQYITFLRDPVERVISYYFHLHRLEKVGTPEGDQSEYIQNYIDNKILIETDNLQTRYLSGVAWQNIVMGDVDYQVKFGECDEKLLQQAKYNLKNYYLFGLQDKFAESLNLFASEFNWNLGKHAFQTTLNKKREKQLDIAPETIQTIKDLNWLDVELYQYAQKLFAKQMKTSNTVQIQNQKAHLPTVKKQSMLSLRQQVAARYLYGHGIEIGALHRPLKVLPHTQVSYVDRMSQEELKQHYPELSKYKLVNVDIIDDGETLESIQDNYFDFVIANQMLEHCQNTIQTIKNHLRVIKPQGILYLTLPDKQYTFDRNRPVTHINHLVEDYTKGPQGSLYSHMNEWVRLVDRVNANEVEAATQKLIATNRNIHFHVFTLESFMELLAWCKNIGNLPIKVELIQANDKEFIVIIRKTK